MLRKLWRMIWERPAYFGLCLVAAGEAFMNSAFGWMSATVWYYSGTLCMIYGGSEMAKWFAAEGLGDALKDGDTGRSWSWFILLVCTLSISIPAHIGFIGMMRGDATAIRETGAETRTNAKTQLDRDRAALAKLQVTRSVEQIELEQQRYKEGGGQWNRLEREKAAAKEAEKLMARIGASETKLGSNQVGMTDARVVVMQWVWRDATAQDLQLILSIAIALAVEAITTFGFLAVGHQGRELLDLERLVVDGAATHPAADQILPFKNEVLERFPGAHVGDGELVAAYERWAAGSGRNVMQRAAFLRLIEACGVKRIGAIFHGVRVRDEFRRAV